MKWKHFPRYWPFVRGIHRSPVNSPHKGQWRGALIFSLICARINYWVNNREAGDLRRYCAHYDVSVMVMPWQLMPWYITSNSNLHPWWCGCDINELCLPLRIIIVQCRYNEVNFLENINKRHPMARPLGRGMGCFLWSPIWLYSASVPAMINAIPYNIGLRCNGTRLYRYLWNNCV